MTESSSYLIQTVAGCDAGAEQNAVQSLSDDGRVFSVVQYDGDSGYGGAPQKHEHLALHALEIACMHTGIPSGRRSRPQARLICHPLTMPQNYSLQSHLK